MASVAQNSFVGGEWAPSLHGRTDLAKYATAVRKMENAYPHPHGGVSNRGGTEFIAEVKTSSRYTRLVPFQFSVVQAYILEFGHNYIRVIKDGALVEESAGAGTDIVKAATYKWTASGSGTNEYRLELAAGGNPLLALPLYIYYNVPASPVTLERGTKGTLSAGQWDYGDNDSLGYSTLYVRIATGADPDTLADGYMEAGYIEEVTTTYAEDKLDLLKFTQSADVLYITHPDFPPATLSRTAHDVWTLANISFGSAIAAPTGLTCAGTGTNYKVTAIDDTGEESVASALEEGAPNNSLTWGAVSGAAYYYVYKDSNKSGTYGWIGQAENTAFTEPTATIDPDYSKTPPESNTPFSGAGNYPGVCAFFDQRLLFARTDNDPQTIWGSVVGSFNNLNSSFPLKDDDGYEFTLNSQQVNEIRSLTPLNDVIVGTSGGEFKMGPGSSGDAITPTSVLMRKQSQWGVSDILPIVIGNTVLFIDGSQKKLRDMLYSLEQDGYAGNDLSLLANHLFTNYQMLEWAYQQHPDSIIWIIRNDGTLLGLTYYREHEVWGWHTHTTDGSFESVASIITDEGVGEVYFVVSRTINGNTKRYIERFKPRLPPNTDYEIDIEDAWFVDSGLEYDGRNTNTAHLMALSGSTWTVGASLTLTASGGHTPFSSGLVGRYYRLKKGADSVLVEVTAYTSTSVVTVTPYNRTVPTSLRSATTDKWALTATTISGLSHLEGKTLVAFADGNVIRNLTVSSGSLTLSSPIARAVFGLGYISNVETLDLEAATQNGTLQDKQRNISSVLLRMENTRGLWTGPNEDRLNEMAFRENEDYGDPTALFTGDKEAVLEAGENLNGRVYLRNIDPVPFTVLSLIARMDYGDA